jgi:hypothetical protein
MTLQRLVIYHSVLQLQPLQHLAPVTRVCIGAIALLLGGLLFYLSRLLATRFTPRVQDIRPLSLPQNQKLRQQLLHQVKREIAQAATSLESARLHSVQDTELPWNGELRVGQKAVKLTTSRQMVEAFQQPQLAKRLLILGASGAGKTTLLMALVAECMARSPADSAQPLPVLLNLSSWTEQYLSFEQWFLIELKAKYGLRLDVGQNWLETHQLLPFLEGFDELDSQRQVLCLQAINQFQQMFQLPGLVVCGQAEAYQRCAVPLNVMGTLWLQPLTLEQVQAYLEAISSKSPLGVAQPPIWQAICKDPQLMRLAQSPLLLHFLLQLDPAPIHCAGDVLALYLKKKLGRDNFYSVSPQGQEPQPSQTLHWVSWLAKNLQKRGQGEFLIERMQPSWLPTPEQRRLHRISVGLMAAILVGAIASLANLITHLGVNSPVFWGVIAGAIAAFPHQISFVETLSWSPAQARRGVVMGLLQGTIGILCLGVFLVAICAVIFMVDPIYLKTIRVTLASGSILGLVIILANGLMGALLTGFLGTAIERRISPKPGIWRSVQNTLIFAVTGFVVGALVSGIFSSIVNLFFDLVSCIVHIPLMFRILYYSPVMLKTGIMMGVISGLIVSISCIQHFILRVMLWYNGSIPWNYDRFLRHVTQQTLMQQTGGRYRFTSKLLRDYLAQSYSPVSRSSRFSEVPVMGSKNT